MNLLYDKSWKEYLKGETDKVPWMIVVSPLVGIVLLLSPTISRTAVTGYIVSMMATCILFILTGKLSKHEKKHWATLTMFLMLPPLVMSGIYLVKMILSQYRR